MFNMDSYIWYWLDPNLLCRWRDNPFRIYTGRRPHPLRTILPTRLKKRRTMTSNRRSITEEDRTGLSDNKALFEPLIGGLVTEIQRAWISLRAFQRWYKNSWYSTTVVLHISSARLMVGLLNSKTRKGKHLNLPDQRRRRPLRALPGQTVYGSLFWEALCFGGRGFGGSGIFSRCLSFEGVVYL